MSHLGQPSQSHAPQRPVPCPTSARRRCPMSWTRRTSSSCLHCPARSRLRWPRRRNSGSGLLRRAGEAGGRHNRAGGVTSRDASRCPGVWSSEVVRCPIRNSDRQLLIFSDNFGQPSTTAKKKVGNISMSIYQGHPRITHKHPGTAHKTHVKMLLTWGLVFGNTVRRGCKVLRKLLTLV